MQKASKSIFIASVNDSMEDRAALTAFIHKKNPELQKYGISLIPRKWGDMPLRIPLAENQAGHGALRDGNDLYVFLFGAQANAQSKEEFGRALKILDAQIDDVRSAKILIYFRSIVASTFAHIKESRQSFDEVIALEERVKFDLAQRSDSYSTQAELLLKFDTELNKQLLPEILKLAEAQWNAQRPPIPAAEAPVIDTPVVSAPIDDIAPTQRVEVFGSVKIEFVNLPESASGGSVTSEAKPGYTITPNILTMPPIEPMSISNVTDIRQPEKKSVFPNAGEKSAFSGVGERKNAFSNTSEYRGSRADNHSYDEDYDDGLEDDEAEVTYRTPRISVKEVDEFAKGAIVECNGPRGAVVEVVSTGAVVVEVISADGVSVEGISATSEEPDDIDDVDDVEELEELKDTEDIDGVIDIENDESEEEYDRVAVG